MRLRLRTLALLLALLSCSYAFFGCHGQKKEEDSSLQAPLMQEFVIPAEFDTSKQYEITFWAKNDTNITQVNIYKQAVADFEALYPNIKVKLKLYTDYGRIYSDVITNIPTSTTPNVCITYPDHVATYLTGANTVVPLDSLIADEKYGLGGSALKFDSPTKSEIVTKYLDEGIIDGKYYTLPYMRSTEACYVNRTYVEKLGFTMPDELTWDFIWQVCEKAVEKDADGNYLVNGQKTLIPFIYKSTDNMMIQMLSQKNAGYSDNEGNVLIFNETTDELLLDIAEHTKNEEFSTFKISSYPANFLNAGQCIFAVDSTAGATWMGSGAPNIDIPEESLIDFTTEVMTVPQFDTSSPKMISQGPSVCIFNKTDPNEVLASWLFAQYLLTNEVQIAYSQTEGYVPVTTKAQTSAEYVDYLSREGEDGELYYDVKLKATKLAIANTDNTFVTPVFNGSASLRNAAGQLIEEVAKGVRRGKTIDEKFLTDLKSEMTSLYHLDSIGPSNNAQKTDFGALPPTAIALISVLAVTWGLILAYLVLKKFLGKKSR